MTSLLTKIFTGTIRAPFTGKSLTCPFKEWWLARKYFKRPHLKFYCGRIGRRFAGVYTEDSEIKDTKGNPLFKKGDPIITQCGLWHFMTWEYLKWYKPKWMLKYFPLTVTSHSVLWKDKWDSPRFERPGIFSLIWGTDIMKAVQFCFIVEAPKVKCDLPEEKLAKLPEEHSYGDSEEYWEMMLWHLYYNNEVRDLSLSAKSFPWGEKTTIIDSEVVNLGPDWNRNFLTKKGKKITDEIIKNKDNG